MSPNTRNNNSAPANSNPNANNGARLTNPNLSDDYPDYSQGWDSLTVGLVNQDEDLENMARFRGDNRAAENINSSRGIRGLIKRVWQGGIARSYYRQKNVNAAREEILNAETLAVDYNNDERRRYNRDICRNFVSEVEGVIDAGAGDNRESLLRQHPDLHARISNIVSQYADGTITDLENAGRQFNEAIDGFRDEHGNAFGEGHLSVSNIRDVAIEARHRFNDLTTVADATFSRLEHDDAMERVMAGFDVLYGNRSNDHLAPRYNRVDRIVDRLQESRVGSLVTPETIGLAAGAAMSVAEFFGKRMTSTVFAAVPGLSAAVVGGVKAGTTFEQERFRAKVDTRYNRDFDENQRRREEVMDTLHDHHNVHNLVQDLHNRAQAISDLQANGNGITAQRDELLTQVARVKTYLDLEKTGDSVLSFTSELDAPNEKLDLLVSFAEAKRFLRTAGIDDIDNRLENSSELMQNVIQDIEGNIGDAQTRARKTKINRILKKGALGFTTGAATGIVVQEVSAFFNPNVTGLFENGQNDNVDASLTAGRRLAGLIGLKPNNVAFTATDDLAHNAIIDSSKDFDFAKQPNGSYSLVKNGRQIAKNIQWDPKTGALNQQTINQLKSQGIDVSKTGNTLTYTHKIPVTSTTTVTKSAKDALANSHEGTSVTRLGWYNNNTDPSDLNELRAYYYSDPATGKPGFVTNMTDWGSFTGNQHAIFSRLAQNGQIKLFVSLSRDTQEQPIEIIGKLLNNGQMAFVPKSGSLAEQCFAPDGTFIGRFGEIAQVLGTDASGREIIMPLATAVGNGLSSLTTTEETTDWISQTINIPEYLFSIPGSNNVQFPMLFPIVPDGAMNASGPSRFTRRGGIIRQTISGYGYDEYGNAFETQTEGNGLLDIPDYEIVERSTSGVYDDREQLKDLGYGDISPNIMRRETLELGQETARYAQLLRDHLGDNYADNLERQVQSSEELRNLNNNVETILTVPVHGPNESDNIYGTLSLYAQQKNINFDSLVILLDINWRGDRESMDPAERDRRIQATRDEIERARQDFPQLHIATFEQPDHRGIGDVARMMNDVALTAIDDAIKAGRMESNHEVLVLRNDADAKNLSADYVSSYQAAFRENPKTPLFTGTTWFDIERTKRAPGFGAILTIERMNNLFGALNGNIHTAGANFGYRASHFAAINGYGFDLNRTGAGSDDVGLGLRMEGALRTAYNNRADNSGNPNDRTLMDPQTRMLVRVGGASLNTNDTRYLMYYDPYDPDRRDLVTNDAYRPGGYNSNITRPSDGEFDNFSEPLNDPEALEATIDQFERELSDYFTLEGGNSDQLSRIISWFFRAPADQIFTLEEDTNYSGREEDFTPYKFALTDFGRQQFRPILESRFGTGDSTDNRNSLQRAIANGALVRRKE